MSKTTSKQLPWKTTAEACDYLSVSRWTLFQMRRDRTLKQGYHWKVKNPNSARLTYLWHVSRIEITQQDVLVD
ncbi:MAG: hypothetical protein AAF773_07680 [Cyanobacteria bacterium P01_D01_bin.115]